ncbi:hypothetical protein P8452_48140 [Trifolium repens]|nr:hypothetical protein P8452_48140 [Trifolium repens]
MVFQNRSGVWKQLYPRNFLSQNGQSFVTILVKLVLLKLMENTSKLKVLIGAYCGFHHSKLGNSELILCNLKRIRPVQISVHSGLAAFEAGKKNIKVKIDLTKPKKRCACSFLSLPMRRRLQLRVSVPALLLSTPCLL